MEQTHHHRPQICAGGGAALSTPETGHAHAGYLVIDLMAPSSERPGLEVVQSKHLYDEDLCRRGHRSRAEPGHCPDDPAWTVRLSERHLAGPMLVALICALSLRMRLSRRRIQELFADWFGLQLSVATINPCLHEAGRVLEPVVEEQLLAEIRASDLPHADETSWKEHGQLLWLWVFTCATTTVFAIGRRTHELLHGQLGTALTGWLMSDGYCAYRDYGNCLRCLTHLVRKARGLEEGFERTARDFGSALRPCLETVMEAVYAAGEGPPPVALRAHHAQRYRRACPAPLGDRPAHQLRHPQPAGLACLHAAGQRHRDLPPVPSLTLVVHCRDRPRAPPRQSRSRSPRCRCLNGHDGIVDE